MTESIPSKRRSAREELRRVESDFFRTVSTLIISAFSLVAALAWNTAITKTLEHYLALKPDSGTLSWLIYALIVTVIAVIVTGLVSRWAERFIHDDHRAEDPKK